MNWLFDRPVYVAILGVGFSVPIAIAWVMSGRKEVLYVLAAAFALFVALLIMERVVITDREAVETTVQQIARDVQANNLQAVQRHVHSAAPLLQQRVQKELPNYVFTECRITSQPEIEVNAKDQPRSAKVSFLAAAAGDFKYEGMSASATKGV
jgi:divalent metal cation (Fe/Co/Zn/Cd) transporter